MLCTHLDLVYSWLFEQYIQLEHGKLEEQYKHTFSYVRGVQSETLHCKFIIIHPAKEVVKGCPILKLVPRSNGLTRYKKNWSVRQNRGKQAHHSYIKHFTCTSNYYTNTIVIWGLFTFDKN